MFTDLDTTTFNVADFDAPDLMCNCHPEFEKIIVDMILILTAMFR